MGFAPAAVAWLDIVASAITTWLLFLVVRRLAGAVPGATAAALYAALTMPAWLYRHGGFLERSVAETFIAVSVAFGAWCAVRLPGRPRALLPAVGLGLASGAAVAFKPNAGLYFLALLAWVAWCSPKSAPLMRTAVIAAAAALAAPALSLIWIWRQGALADARIALVDFNRFYVATSYAAQPGHSYIVDFAKAIWLRMKTDPLWAAGGIGVLAIAVDLIRSRRLDPLPALAVAWGGASALVLVLNGAWLFNTYFVQALPPLAVLAAWVLVGPHGRPPAHKIAAVAVMVVMAVLLVRRNYPQKVFEQARVDFQQWRGEGDAGV
jgi:4-amino-4-deoxy-L-arabinose transferase-like glycosyltransferase